MTQPSEHAWGKHWVQTDPKILQSFCMRFKGFDSQGAACVNSWQWVELRENTQIMVIIMVIIMLHYCSKSLLDSLGFNRMIRNKVQEGLCERACGKWEHWPWVCVLGMVQRAELPSQRHQVSFLRHLKSIIQLMADLFPSVFSGERTPLSHCFCHQIKLHGTRVSVNTGS